MRSAMPQVVQPVLVLIVCLTLCSSNRSSSYAYDVPKATVKVNTPQGFEVSIPDEPGLTLFAFHGKLNEEMDDLSDQTWATDIVTARNGRWTYRNRLQKLQPGDVLYYWTTARYNGIDYHNYNQRYQVGQADADADSMTIDVRSNAGNNQPITIHGNPTINIFVN